MRALIAFLLTALFLTACGFKGPLYLPKPTEATSTSNSQTLIASSPTASAASATALQK
ncbi:LPS translocon maturation chaperone LptM [Deefgea piscis]|uniref:LPS translocon maturation chaperone LptM n=1 Tax=Deefgea piscis TaxID=2739061 RepID=UPI001C81DFF4|nr:lipoprotein [Deefgea piscis]QZA82212.1 lipoprotein [Deefgea piscis]